MKPFWRKTWSPIGATTIFGEWGQYNDQFAAGAGSLCDAFDGSFGTNIDAFCNQGFTDPSVVEAGVFVTGSEVERWGLGVVQEINSAAMHLFARWQHQEISLDLTGAMWCARLANAKAAGRTWARASTIGTCSRSVA